MTFSEPFELTSPTGASLNVRLAKPDQTPRATIHINHGLAEHSARYARFAGRLAEAGFLAVAHDHRGHGQTTAIDAPQGVFSLRGGAVDLVMRDCAAVQDHARDVAGEMPMIMFGHSMGGLITMNYALRHADRLTGAAVWNANFTGGLLGRLGQVLLSLERLRLGSDVPSRIMPRLTFQDWANKIDNRRTEFDWLSHIPEEVDAYINDPHCGWDASVSMWQSIFKMVFAGGKLSNANPLAKALPFMLLGGGEDPATFNGAAVNTHARRMQEAGFQTVRHKRYDFARHETLNDWDSESATDAFIDWARGLS